ncbi:MAG TPA: hypothetical protein VLG12_03090 [Candidatus Saccharimonadales bacterium]|nr:hypothetical protein [Candidatus Saccharimonadales bacterium]
MPIHRQERLQRIQQSLDKEISLALKGAEFIYPDEVEALFAFSGMSLPPGSEDRHNSPDNREVVGYAVLLGKRFTEKRQGIAFESVTKEDIEKVGPLLIVNGGGMQIEAMIRIAEEFGYPRSRILSIPCIKCDEIDAQGRHPFANTNTQFESIPNDPLYPLIKNMRFVAMVGRAEHLPRLVRGADLKMPEGMEITGYCPPYQGELTEEELRRDVSRKVYEYSNFSDPPEEYKKLFGHWPRESADISFFLERTWYGGATHPPQPEATYIGKNA